MSNPKLSWMIRIAHRKGNCNSRDSFVRKITDREWSRSETGCLKWMGLNRERAYLARLWNKAVKESASETTLCPHSVDQRLAPITGKKEDVAIIAGPARRSSTPVQCRGKFSAAAARRIDHPHVSVFRYAINSRHVALGGRVSDPFSIGRPCRFVFATGSLGDLTYLSL